MLFPWILDIKEWLCYFKVAKAGLNLSRGMPKTSLKHFPYTFGPTFMPPIHFWRRTQKNSNVFLARSGILLRNNTKFHMRLIILISDHFDEFYKQKTDQ